MSSDDCAPYLTLIELIERDLALAGESRFDELVTADAERQALISTLPSTPPPEARDLLERATLLQKRLTTELMRGRDELLAMSGILERGRQTARGYAPPRQRALRIAESA